MGYPRLTVERFAEKYAAGKTYQQISAEMCITVQTLARWARDLGLPRRRRGARKGARREA